MRVPPSIVSHVGSWILRLLDWTLRWNVVNPEVLRNHSRADGSPFIFAFWHNRLLVATLARNRYFLNRPRTYAMTSLSGDGELIAQILQRFGIGSVRGSSTRRGAGALRELAKLLKNGHDLSITPDGSRGPVYQIKPGLVMLAQISGCAILPIGFEFSRCVRLKSWDRFFIPLPFSRVDVVLGNLHCIPKTASVEEFEAERRKCEEAMMALVKER